MKKLLAAFLFLPVLGFAQPKVDDLPLGGWHIATLRYQFAPKWSLTVEGQLRSARFGKNFFYHEYKGGVGYDLPNKTQLFLGTGHYTTYNPNAVESFAGPTLSEWRMWEQFTVNNTIGSRLKMDHRFRIEQRFFNDGNYRNRFRYRVNMALPLNNLLLDDNTLFINAYNELFLNNRAPHFERNRLYVGGGYELNKYITFLAGIINQYDYRLDQRLSRNFLQTSLLINIKKGGDRRGVPQAVD